MSASSPMVPMARGLVVDVALEGAAAEPRLVLVRRAARAQTRPRPGALVHRDPARRRAAEVDGVDRAASPRRPGPGETWTLDSSPPTRVASSSPGSTSPNVVGSPRGLTTVGPAKSSAPPPPRPPKPDEPPRTAAHVELVELVGGRRIHLRLGALGSEIGVRGRRRRHGRRWRLAGAGGAARLAQELVDALVVRNERLGRDQRLLGLLDVALAQEGLALERVRPRRPGEVARQVERHARISASTSSKRPSSSSAWPRISRPSSSAG